MICDDQIESERPGACGRLDAPDAAVHRDDQAHALGGEPFERRWLQAVPVAKAFGDEMRHVRTQQLERTSLETVTTPERLLRVAQGGYAPTEIWRALEHGEKVECLNCIPAVSKLLYNDDAKTREISAWWLRRRIFGVFGPGEVYSRLITAVGDLKGEDIRIEEDQESQGDGRGLDQKQRKVVPITDEHVGVAASKP